ncbi:MAG: hypothetical protein NWR72_02315, partial [Bacteroidia bacterium]|nr:hypothetical protein [Bacteroidia bacterium]
MKNRILFGLLVAIVLLFDVPVMATHFTGMEIRTQHLSGNTFRIFTSAYFDCDGAATQQYMPVSNTNIPTTSFLASFGINGPSGAGCSAVSVGSWTYDAWLEVTPVCPSYNTACSGSLSPISGTAFLSYYRDYTFPCTLPYELTMSNCCISSSITSGAADEGIYLSHTFTAVANNNPSLPPTDILICSQGVSNFDLSAVDPDGDNLHYRLEPVYKGNGLVQTYAPGYSATQPLGANWSVSLDSLTGILSFAPGPLAGLEKTLIRVVTDEYNAAGVKVGSSQRILPILVTDCMTMDPEPVAMGFQNLSGAAVKDSLTLELCGAAPTSFQILVGDSDSTQVVHYLSGIQKSLPGAVVTATPGNPAVISVAWTPDSSTIFPLALNLLVADDACPLPNQTVIPYQLKLVERSISAVVTKPACFQDTSGSITLNLSGGIGPFLFQWANGDTGITTSNHPVGYQTYTFYDVGCGISLTDSVFIFGNDLSITTSKQDPTCDQTNGTISVDVTGGIAPYTFWWTNGANTDSISGLAAGGYQVVVSDYNGCLSSETLILEEPDSCFNLLDGIVFLDQNGNCVQDSLEPGIPGILVHLGNGTSVMTDSSGAYMAQVGIGLFEISVTLPSYLFNSCGADTLSLSFSTTQNDTSGLNFPIAASFVQDLAVSVVTDQVIWNGQQKTYALIQNDGGLPVANASVSLEYDPIKVSAYAFSVPPSQIDTLLGIVTWNISLLTPGQSGSVWMGWTNSANIFIGDSVDFTAQINPIAGDSFPANNVAVTTSIVLGSYDPNDKLVTPAGIGEAGFILPTTDHLDYTIRFQNTGNFPASYVILRDTLSPQLELSGFRQIGSSHPFSLVIEEDSIMVFTFANINLPDSMSDPLGSQGFVSFRMGLEQNLPIGTEITNQAAIYFDFNPPIFTNTVLNTIYTQPEVKLTEQPFYCVGDPIFANITATGKPPYTYDWNFGGPSTTTDTTDVTLIFQSGWYVVTVTDAFGFSDTDSVLVNTEPGIFADFDWELTG